jgi:ribosomal protein L37E
VDAVGPRTLSQPHIGTALQQCYNTSVPKKAETRIIECKRCGIHTRHEREEWIQRSLPLLLLTGRVKLITAWRCTKCGKRRSARTRYAMEERA